MVRYKKLESSSFSHEAFMMKEWQLLKFPNSPTTFPTKIRFILLDEIPAFHGPKYAPTEMDFQDCIPICLTCGLRLTQEKNSKCSICNWPVCSPECAKMYIHAENECRIFSNAKVVYPPESLSPTELSMCILMIRGTSLKKKNKKVYEELMQLQDSHALPNITTMTMYQHACDKLKILIGPLQETEEEYQKILRLATINAFSVDYQEENSEHTMFRNRTATYMYVKTSRMNNSCVPNCTRSIGQKPNFMMRIRTSIPIKKGDPLTICYAEGAWNMLDTLGRQQSNQKGGGFICKCERCLDPTEMGSMMSAITCPECYKKDSTNSGYFLPQDPLDTSESAVWLCTTCKDTLKDLSKVKQIGDLFEKMNSDVELKFNGIFESFCENLVTKYSSSFLHKNHWILHAAARARLKLMTPKMMRLDKRGYEKYIELSLYSLAIVDKISPGISFDRGSMLLHTSRALAELVSKYSKELSRDQRSEYLTLCRKLQEEAYEYHKSDIPPPNETFSYDAQNLKSEMQSVRLLSWLELGNGT